MQTLLFVFKFCSRDNYETLLLQFKLKNLIFDIYQRIKTVVNAKHLNVCNGLAQLLRAPS